MIRRMFVIGFGLMVLYAGAGEAWGGEKGISAPTAPVPKALQKGEALFNGKCAPCHGTRGVGTAKGLGIE